MTSAAAAIDAPLRFAKMNGIGNSILVVDTRGHAALDEATARFLGARPGLGFDQLMAIGDGRGAGRPPFVDIFNQDGSKAGACGNGTRCVAWFLLEGSADQSVTVETVAGELVCRRQPDGLFTVDMGVPHVGWHDIPLRDAIEDTTSFALEPTSAWIEALGPVSAVSMGNPHAVFWIAPDAPQPPLATLGPALEHHPMFPDRANISFARVMSPTLIHLDVWERGAGLTKACGSAACATLVAAVRNHRVLRRADVVLPGGTLTIEWRDTDQHVLMTGAVELEHRGLVDRNATA
ncbi:diaminopimelate epimerase [Lichenihabitans psoromatis]|uniref:diaminopimelate epimerase n=1 Tax=Lichenihabitans psoromatis TaxID=2528642 RepID=UPI0010366888|nr:diaminopimelate epimerase [Lichenihabitans psoromatis]